MNSITSFFKTTMYPTFLKVRWLMIILIVLHVAWKLRFFYLSSLRSEAWFAIKVRGHVNPASYQTNMIHGKQGL